MRKWNAFPALFLLLSAATIIPPTPVFSSTLYAILSDELDGSFAEIDLATGNYTKIGSSNVRFGKYAPVFDPATNQVLLPDRPVGSSSFGFNVIDTQTGAVRDVSLTGNSAFHSTVTGMTVDPTSGRVFGVIVPPAVGINAFLAEINPTTGAVTKLGNSSLPQGDYAPVFNPVTNKIVVTGDPIGTLTNLVRTFDATTGAETSFLLPQGNLFKPPIGAGFAVDPKSGMLFGVIFEGGIGFIAKIDPATGAYIKLSHTTLPFGNYAVLYDPDTNKIILTATPLDNKTFTPGILTFDAITGAETDIFLQPPAGITIAFIEGLVLGASDAVAAVPELSTWTMMILGFAGMGFMAYRRSRKDQGLALAAV